VRFLERALLVALAVLAVMRFLPSFELHPQTILVLASEIVGVVFILAQRKGVWSTDPYTTLIAFLGTAAPLCIVNEGKQALIPEYISAMLVLSGTTIALLAKLSLRRSFGVVPANRGVKKDGAYRFVRHPMYTGYVINHIGLLLVFPSVWNICVYLVTWTLLAMRAEAEEKFLRQDPEYVEYAGKVRSRIIPGLI
jgi:protein-S-isoprenylcysteine O-methyltransferase Ste14